MEKMELFIRKNIQFFQVGIDTPQISNLRLLALVYSHFYDLDMVTFSSLTNKQLRLMNFFSLELEDLQ